MDAFTYRGVDKFTNLLDQEIWEWDRGVWGGWKFFFKGMDKILCISEATTLKTSEDYIGLYCSTLQGCAAAPPKCTVALLVLCITLLFWCLGLMAVMAYFPSCSIFVAVPKAIKHIFVMAQKTSLSACFFLTSH